MSMFSVSVEGWKLYGAKIVGHLLGYRCVSLSVERLADCQLLSGLRPGGYLPVLPPVKMYLGKPSAL